MKAIIRLPIILLTLLSAFSTAFGQTVIVTPGLPTRPSHPFESEPIPDAEFVQRVGQGLIFEVLAANLALFHSNSPAVQKFARRIIRDGSRDFQKLSAVAIRAGFQVPVGPSEDQKTQLKQLTKLFGPAFNQQYLQSTIQELLNQINESVAEVHDGIFPTIRAFANRRLPSLYTDLQLAFTAARQSGSF